ncbi:MAG TPA: addiction module protein [Pirellulales bacterium]|nr:addiction module protein [Pirellulales bacterium]
MSSVDQLFHDAFALSPEIKLKLIHELWDDLAANPSDVPVHDWQIEELERRKRKLSEDPTTAMSWDEFDRRLRERYGF